jgi:hypothetical protein
MLPTIRIGDHDITRLVIGGNPFSGGSHYSSELDKAFIDYYSNENMKRALLECESAGLNTMQSRGDRHIMRMVNEYRNEGGTLQWIVQTASELRDLPRHVRQIAGQGAIGIYHHGTRTDQLWFDGRIDEVQDLLKVMRDQGVLVGLGTHLFEVIEYADEHDWDVDFYLACFYRLSDEPRESPVVAGAHQKQERYDDVDRARMVQTIQQTPKPCFGFKILAANRKCDSPESVREAFEFAFANIKPTDAVIVGMYQEHINQVEMNANLVAEICGAPVAAK